MTAQDKTVVPKLLEQGEHYIYIAAGFILIIAAAGLIIIGVVEMIGHVLDGNYIRAMVQLLDRILLVLMVTEVVYTIGRITRTKMLEVEPFLIIGIIAAVRRVLIITAETTEHLKIGDPAFQAAMVEMGVLALMIFLIAVAMRILRAKKSVE